MAVLLENTTNYVWQAFAALQQDRTGCAPKSKLKVRCFVCASGGLSGSGGWWCGNRRKIAGNVTGGIVFDAFFRIWKADGVLVRLRSRGLLECVKVVLLFVQCINMSLNV